MPIPSKFIHVASNHIGMLKEKGLAASDTKMVVGIRLTFNQSVAPIRR